MPVTLSYRPYYNPYFYLNIDYTMPRHKTARRRFQKKALMTMRRFKLGQRITKPLFNQLARGIHYFKRTTNGANDTYFSVDGTVCSDAGNKLTVYNTAVAGGTTVYGTLSYTFVLSGIPSVTEFTSLFDAYQIRKVVVKITPTSNSSNANTTGYGDWSPIMHYAIDHDDGASPTASETGVTELQQYPSYKVARLQSNKPLTIVVKPRIATALYKGAFTGYGQGSRNTWIDCNSADVEHYGLKAVIEAVSPSATGVYATFRVDTTYYLKFKGVR